MKDDEGYCNAHGEMHGDCYAAELSESALIGLLSQFRRYRDALKQYPHIAWTDEKCKQWEDDKTFYREEYRKVSGTSFDVAEKHAHERLFLRCAGR